jgi:hypothetical protein
MSQLHDHEEQQD